MNGRTVAGIFLLAFAGASSAFAQEARYDAHGLSFTLPADWERVPDSIVAQVLGAVSSPDLEHVTVLTVLQHRNTEYWLERPFAEIKTSPVMAADGEELLASYEDGALDSLEAQVAGQDVATTLTGVRWDDVNELLVLRTGVSWEDGEVVGAVSVQRLYRDGVVTLTYYPTAEESDAEAELRASELALRVGIPDSLAHPGRDAVLTSRSQVRPSFFLSLLGGLASAGIVLAIMNSLGGGARRVGLTRQERIGYRQLVMVMLAVIVTSVTTNSFLIQVLSEMEPERVGAPVFRSLATIFLLVQVYRAREWARWFMVMALVLGGAWGLIELLSTRVVSAGLLALTVVYLSCGLVLALSAPVLAFLRGVRSRAIS